jgi:DNA (cytosine-5)-methyltransferase 1
VARKKWKANSVLKYWIMENVPNSATFIKEKYSAKELNLLGDKILYVKNNSSDVYNATYFGVPSRRKRYLCGEFPEPRKTNGKESKRPLSFVLKALGKPFEKINETISDPLYSITVHGNTVTDHHYLQPVAKHQWEQAKRLKQDKGYMGKMAFPENENKPARTIMATLTFGARESMILANNTNGYRAPTIREVASLMSFPVTYNFMVIRRNKNRLVGTRCLRCYPMHLLLLSTKGRSPILAPNFSASKPNPVLRIEWLQNS